MQAGCLRRESELILLNILEIAIGSNTELSRFGASITMGGGNANTAEKGNGGE